MDNFELNNTNFYQNSRSLDIQNPDGTAGKSFKNTLVVKDKTTGQTKTHLRSVYIFKTIQGNFKIRMRDMVITKSSDHAPKKEDSTINFDLAKEKADQIPHLIKRFLGSSSSTTSEITKWSKLG
jgi:hypothetical protein